MEEIKDSTMQEPGQPEQLSVAIDQELQHSYLDYAMSVIIGRALPDVRDGLKPVHRRTLFAMQEMGNTYNRPFIKSARIVGEVLGKYHPHGDSAAYDTLARMAQNFSMRYLLVDGQGNFGSMDGDRPAAMRYTEARMTKLVQEMNADLDKDTVDFVPNYDNSLQEPSVLPTRVPNLLINGSEGIAVGMATKIPPHNLTEVMNGLIALVDNPDIKVHELMTHITGPDFPTGGVICGHAGIREAYETGRGVVVIRAKSHVEQHKDHESIVVTEIPYQQNKAQMVDRIKQLIKEKEKNKDKGLDSIAEVRDESDRHGIRVVLELKRDAISPDIILNLLYKQTPLQKSFGIIFLCIVNDKPEILNLKQMLQCFLAHRRNVVYRRTGFELKKAEERAHILEGLRIALDNIDEVVALIRASKTPDEAKAGLMERFNLSEIQAQTILDMRLQRLTGLEREKIEQEYAEVMAKIQWCNEVLSKNSRLMEVVREEFVAIRDTYGDGRRTEIIDEPDELLPEDLIAQETMVVTVTHGGYIKRNPLSLYRAQGRGGKGVKGMNTLEDDFVSKVYTASTLDTFIFFTNTGRVFWRKVYELPLSESRNAKGKPLVNFLELEREAADENGKAIRVREKVAAILPVADLANADDSLAVLTVTKKGQVKKTSIAEYKRPLKKGKVGLTIREDDEILTAAIASGTDHIILVTRNGLAIRFEESDVRVMGRLASGVKGLNLGEDDEVVGVALVSGDDYSLLTVCENGYGKRTAVAEYPVQNRGGKGVLAIKTSERNGKVVGVLTVRDEDQVMLITKSGQTIRMPMDSLRLIGRNTQGVRLINLTEGELVADLSMLAPEDLEDEVADGEAELGDGAPSDVEN